MYSYNFMEVLQNIYANTSHFIGKAQVPVSRSADTNLNVSTNLNASSSNNASPSTNNTNVVMDSSSNQSYHDLNSTKLSPIRSGSSASSTNALGGGHSYAHQQRHQGQPRTPRHSQRRQRGRVHHGEFDSDLICTP